jgi:hypothetical protein
MTGTTPLYRDTIPESPLTRIGLAFSCKQVPTAPFDENDVSTDLSLRRKESLIAGPFGGIADNLLLKDQLNILI